MMRALVVGYVWPEPASSAAGTRMLELVQLLVRMDYQVTFASAAALSEHRFDLNSLGVTEKAIALNCSSFDEFVRELNPNLVLFDRFFTEEQFGWRVEQACPDAVRVLDTEDLHSLRHARQQLLKSAQKLCGNEKEKQSVAPITADSELLYRQMCKGDMAVREVAAIFRCDLSLMISEFEIDLLQRYFSVPSQLLFYCPFLSQQKVDVASLPDFSARQHFIAIGNFRHEPNWDSVLWLKHQLWPIIRAQLSAVGMAQAELHIYGAYPPPKATQLHNTKEGFHIKGWAADAQAVMQSARVCLAPLRFGAGIKGKLMDAMRCGTPSITTSIGVESMSGGLLWGGAVADDAETFVAAAVAHYQDETLWQQKQQQGFAILRDYFHRTDHSLSLQTRLTELLHNLQRERGDNFIGQMLRHHSHKSTQYMGQWIEAKNK
ncbi:glycosyltransferase involved in cell wall biosynthesis [Cellvibrio fibrivorans]|uniref:Glycosyltransferase involved in cell wall biosynthesis n=2 Tax=Cellvibrio fibrivorans TaxID=126350 RepID=A0ABU1UZ94_9GAMM|nr:glycosyltransferase involved in cell wall biosynthesis [Cellvibrio fibrivorans]